MRYKGAIDSLVGMESFWGHSSPGGESEHGYSCLFNGNAGIAGVIPSHFLVKTLTDDIKLGFSVVGTMGGGLDYGNNFVGRYAAYRVSINQVYN